jgi:hypothetical protein
MLHYSCDLCKRPIDSKAGTRHVVKIEVFPAVEDSQPCECHGPAEGDADHLEEIQGILEMIDGEDAEFEDATRSMRFDLCDACRLRFVKNPLGVKSGKHFDFSQN